MHKNERHGITGAIENTLDDLRHTWERLWFDRKVTGEVDMFVKSEPETPQILSTAELFDKFYGRSAELSVNEHTQNREPPEIER